MTNEILTTALRFLSQGISVVPVAADGSKRPALYWHKYQSQLATTDELVSWFKQDTEGIGVICGKISGNLEMLELEGRAVASKMHLDIAKIAENSGFDDLWQRLNAGYVEMTPSGGLHWLYRLNDGVIGGNLKLARKPGENGGVDVFAETRSEGGFTITAPSGGATHPNGGNWLLIGGSIETIPVITSYERSELHKIFAMFDEMPKVETIQADVIAKHDGTLSPGDDYNARTTWDEILLPLNWTKVYQKGEATVWRRPNKNEGVSATTNFNGNDKLFVFSTSTVFDAESSYSKFAAFAHLNCAGDFKQAAIHLRNLGYGVGIDNLTQYIYSPLTGEIVENSAGLETEDENLVVIDYLTQQEIKLARAKRYAKKLLDIEEASADFKMPEYFGNLGEELALPKEEAKWLIKNLFPTGSNVTLTAQFKAGKTTLINSLTRSLADGEKFLDYFDAPVHPGNIVIFNYEVNKQQYRDWFTDVKVQNFKKVHLHHMKGSIFNMLSPLTQDKTVELLTKHKAETWIIDPFAGAFTGSGDENSNSDVTVFLNILDNIKMRAGVSNLVMPIHTGRAQEHGIDRARGATRLDDWADVRWILKKTSDGRFFSADGRDVLIEEQALTFDPITRSLVFGGADAYMTKKLNNEELWFNTVIKNQGRTTSEIAALLNKRVDDKGMQAARKSLLAQRRLKIDRKGTSDVWYDINYIAPYEQSEVG